MSVDMEERVGVHGGFAFALIYLTFFLDNVLLTVLVPIIPDWVRGEALALWATRDAPLAALLNTTVRRIAADEPGAGGSQAIVGLVLGAKAGAQLLTAPLASAAVCRCGPAPVLRVATALLALAAVAVAGCSGVQGAPGAWCVGAARAAQGGGAALAGVAGLALAAAALPAGQRDRAIGALLGAVALGVLVGYPFGGVANALWSRAAPFLLIAAALLVNLVMQYMFLDREEFCQASPGGSSSSWGWHAGMRDVLEVSRRGSCAACAGAVLLTTCVMAALEPCLPLWLLGKFHPQRWQTGAVFIPDSAGYLVAASCVGGAARRLGPERVALAAQLAVGLAALAVPLATSVSWLGGPHLVLGLGLGATDAALVPALMARHSSRVPHVAALLQQASSVAYTLGPVLGGLVSWACGFEATLRALGVLNLLYLAVLYRALREHPLSEQWGASAGAGGSESERAGGSEGEGAPLRPQQYVAMH